MRAERLLSILMLLQTRGQMKARELARLLDVSERTINRDIDSLSASGIPVYGEPGPNGGFALLDSYRTNLTGLNEREVRALFVLTIPAPFSSLSMFDDLKSALLKMSAALPEAYRTDERKVRQRIHVDWVWWRQGELQTPHLQSLYQAVWHDQKLFMTYQPQFSAVIRRQVCPYGLVAKAGVWYLVFARDDRLRVHRVSDIISVEPSDDKFVRPEGFDLAAYWMAWCSRYENRYTSFKATLRVSPDALSLLSKHIDSGAMSGSSEAEAMDVRGWLRLQASFESFHVAREQLLSLGGCVEVLEPETLRCSLHDMAQQIVQRYERDVI